MIRHIVSWKLQAENAQQREKNAAEAKQRLEDLNGKIDGLLHLEVAIDLLDSSTADLCLYSELAGADALAHYQSHPAHVEAGAFMKTIVHSRHCVDFVAADGVAATDTAHTAQAANRGGDT